MKNNGYLALQSHFAGKRALITGGLGFIGSTLAIRLVNLGTEVTILDALLPEYGGNLFNIQTIEDQVHLNICDIQDQCALDYLVRGQDYIFHLAGQVSHLLSQSNPFPDIDYNIKGTAVLMEALKKHNPSVRVIYTGTRGQYGKATRLPVNEDAPTEPRGLYEISNLTAEKIIKVYSNMHNISSVLLRLTNIYGPRAQMKHSHFGVVNWFIRQAIDNQTIQVFGDGSIKRDFLFVEDCVNAILLAAACPDSSGEIFNVGLDKPTNFLELAQEIVRIAGTGRWEFAPFSPERKAQEPGDFYSDITKIRKFIGWEPRTSLVDGLAKTIDYYRKYKEHYW